MARDCILSVDVGTQSLKAGVYNSELQLIERQQVALKTQFLAVNRVEMDAEDIWKALISAIDSLKHKDRVAGLVFSTLCPSLVPISKDGKVLGPVILHQDRRSAEQSAFALERVGEENFLRINGNLPVPGGISLTSILWIKENNPEIYNRRDVCFGHVITLLLKRLCGVFVIDPSNASFTGLFDTVGFGTWHKELYEPLGIDPEKLPEIIMSDSVAGELCPQASKSLGLPIGLPVGMGANDTTSAAIGAGVTQSGMMMNTSGSVDILVLCLDKPLVSKQHLLRTHAYSGHWLAMRTVGAGGSSLEWFRLNFCRELTRQAFYNDYLPEVLAEHQRAESVFLPYLSGNRHSVDQETASFSNITLKTDRDELLLALLTGIVDFQFDILKFWQENLALNNIIYHVGGGAQDAYTAFKQRKLNAYKLVQIGETAMAGAAKLGFEVLFS
jgi:sugar (pentulose or hexulose) kinase